MPRRIRSVDVIAQRHAFERHLRSGHSKRVFALEKGLLAMPVQKAAKIDTALMDVLEYGLIGGRKISADYAPDKVRPTARDILRGVKKADPLIGDYGANWAKKHSGKLIIDISKAQERAVRKAITLAQREGHHPGTISKLVRNLVGLDQRRASALTNFKLSALKSGVSESKVDAMADRYHKRLVRQRADVIARQETQMAMNVGRTSLWHDIVDTGVIAGSQVTREWMASMDERMDEDGICEALHGEKVGLDDEFPGGYYAPPDPHVLCRCDVLIEVE